MTLPNRIAARLRALPEAPWLAALALVALAFVAIVFAAEALIRCVHAGSALPALWWGLPAVLSLSTLYTIYKSPEGPVN